MKMLQIYTAFTVRSNALHLDIVAVLIAEWPRSLTTLKR